MKTGIWVLGDQLSHSQSALAKHYQTREQTPVILIEAENFVRERRYHQQKLVLVWSAMRHFAEELKSQGWLVTYAITADFAPALEEWIRDNHLSEVEVMTPSDRPFVDLINHLQLECTFSFTPNNHFFWSVSEFQTWAKSRKRLLLEDFYREGRKRFQILMEGNTPVGEKWNLDKENRQPPKDSINPPKPLWFEPDAITQEVINKVKYLKFPTYGKLENFSWGVSREQAKKVLEHFITEVFPTFGPYQDAMMTGQQTLWHSLISPYLNMGLLTPQEVVKTAQQAYYDQNLPLNSAEGFIRQVLGWREYMHGFYHNVSEDYFAKNWFNHTQPLPEFYWDSSKTQMNCFKQVLQQVEEIGYAHHIQRLMVLSSFALIAGISPQALEDWFHSAFIDAYDWVMQTNVLGMGQFADGGMLASKPYACSANYINKMSNYCRNCSYDHKASTGENACPFNYFYWDFLARHRETLHSQGRMNLILASLEKKAPTEIAKMRSLAQAMQDQL